MGQNFSSLFYNNIIEVNLHSTDGSIHNVEVQEKPEPESESEPEPEPEPESEPEPEPEQLQTSQPEIELDQIELSNIPTNDFVPSPLIEPVQESDQLNFPDRMFTSLYVNKKALLIGINYDSNESNDDNLNGCENDMNRLSDYLQENCHFCDYSIKKLNSRTATKETIINEINEMVGFAQRNRCSELWFSYSGHGTHYFSFNEDDNQNEAICPSDYIKNGLISDDWLKENFINKLPDDCKLFVLMDCCHSGSNMDLPYFVENNIVSLRDNMTIPQAKVIKFSGCLDDQVSMDYYNYKHREFQGAFTNSFVESFKNENMINNLGNINIYLKLYDFKQVSELALSHKELCYYKLF